MAKSFESYLQPNFMQVRGDVAFEDEFVEHLDGRPDSFMDLYSMLHDQGTLQEKVVGDLLLRVVDKIGAALPNHNWLPSVAQCSEVDMGDIYLEDRGISVFALSQTAALLLGNPGIRRAKILEARSFGFALNTSESPIVTIKPVDEDKQAIVSQKLLVISGRVRSR